MDVFLSAAPAGASIPARVSRWLLCAAVPFSAAVAADAGDVGLDCVITPSAQVAVASAAPGLIERVHVDRSDRVERGTVLAELEAGVERAAVDLAREWSSFDTEIKLEGVTLANEQRKRKRMEDLYKRRQVSREDKDDADTRLRASRLRLQEATERRRLRTLEARQAEAALARRTIRSPVNGVVVERLRQEGEYVEDDAIVRVARLDPLFVETIVPMRHFGKVAVGASAEVHPEAPASGPVAATVLKVDALGDPASGTFGVRLLLPNADDAVPAGLKCRVRIDGLVLDDAPPAAPRS